MNNPFIEQEKKEARLSKLASIEFNLTKTLCDIGINLDAKIAVSVGQNYIVFKSNEHRTLIARKNGDNYELSTPQLYGIVPDSDTAAIISVCNQIIENWNKTCKSFDIACNEYNQLLINSRNGNI